METPHHAVHLLNLAYIFFELPVIHWDTTCDISPKSSFYLPSKAAHESEEEYFARRFSTFMSPRKKITFLSRGNTVKIETTGQNYLVRQSVRG